mgnify:CR=1 FL=1|jgi:hypothetical protein
MAYENVNVSKLNTVLSSMSNIKQNAKKLQNFKNGISYGSWQGNTRTKIIKAMEKMIDLYNELDSYVNDCKQATYYIYEYQNLDSQNDKYNSKMNLENRKIKNADETEDTSDEESLVRMYKNKISNNNYKKSELMKKIENLIN